MKNVLYLIILITVSTTSFSQNEKVKEKIKGPAGNVKYAYSPTYSSQFEMGNSAYASIVLDAWKGYDDNNWDVLSASLADTMVATLANGTVIKGKENFLNGIKSYRGSFASVTSTVSAWLPVKSIDRNESWVCIWGNETDKKQDGNTVSVGLHELWRFNRDGKVDFFSQFTQERPKQ